MASLTVGPGGAVTIESLGEQKQNIDGGHYLGQWELRAAWVTTMARGDQGATSANKRPGWGPGTNQRRGEPGADITKPHTGPWHRVMGHSCTLGGGGPGVGDMES